jgi:hypothetical protein
MITVDTNADADADRVNTRLQPTVNLYTKVVPFDPGRKHAFRALARKPVRPSLHRNPSWCTTTEKPKSTPIYSTIVTLPFRNRIPTFQQHKQSADSRQSIGLLRRPATLGGRISSPATQQDCQPCGSSQRIDDPRIRTSSFFITAYRCSLRGGFMSSSNQK